MSRHAFLLRIRPGKIADYEQTHRHVWPELLQVLQEAGIRNYSIFRRDLDLFLYLEAEDFEAAWKKVERSDANRRWQEYMAPIIEQHPSRRLEERFAMLKEVFHME